MKLLRLLLCALPLLGVASFVTTDAQACGGCLIAQNETTQVTGHRMILSIAQARTTLWDQIKYSGNPASFAWVLPIKGTVQVALSSDALFKVLEDNTQVQINSPTINCLPPDCGFGGGVGASSATSGGGGVVVIAEEVVGPYETVQLSSQDPNALKNWLLDKGYNLPLDISPIVDAYVAEGFNFLAMKLVPGQGIDSMRPVRVTSTGATPVLPLRMVAAGTGFNTPITLWVLGEGRYEAANFPNFTIKEADLVWNWDTQSSNYSQLKDSSFTASQGKAWLTEAAEPMSKYTIEDPLLWTVNNDPVASGYGGDPMGPSAFDECTADLDALYGSIGPNLWVTRMHGELSRQALGTDLNLQASASQSPVQRNFYLTNTTGTQPECPPPPDWCTSSGSGSGSTSGGNNMPPVDTNPWDNNVGNGNGQASTASCAMTNDSGIPTTLVLLGAVVGLGMVRRRNRERSS